MNLLARRILGPGGPFAACGAGARRGCIFAWAVLVMVLALPTSQPSIASEALASQAVRFEQADRLRSDGLTPPPREDPWELAIKLPDRPPSASGPEPGTDASSHAYWYRLSFKARGDREGAEPLAVFLPYFYAGGQIWLNGQLVANIRESDETHHVRWERPHLIGLPPALLNAGDNTLALRSPPSFDGAQRHVPRIDVGPDSELRPVFDRRAFWARTAAQVTVVVCLLAAALVLGIWSWRRSEVLYGIFGAAALLWGLRTLTFVVEVVPSSHWVPWRAGYLAATGGFIVAMAIFAIRLVSEPGPTPGGAISRRPRWLRFRARIEIALVVYGAIGPIALLVSGADAESVINRWWTGGLVPVGVAILALAVLHVLHRRTPEAALVPLAMALAVLAGLHDYAIAWDLPIARALPGDWWTRRLFLLHHGANLLLLAMGVVLATRFVRALGGLEAANAGLEARVADRERHLAANFERLAALQQQHAVAEEREFIMREIHDGLGSRLFTSLMQVERGALDTNQIADALRACIGDMRLALDALTPDDHDFRTVFGNFRYRWQTQLDDAHLTVQWHVDLPDRTLALAPQSTLALLRIAQEAFTNLLKHAQASKAQVRLTRSQDELILEIRDDGVGNGSTAAPSGRGLANMRARAAQLAGRLSIEQSPAGTCVSLRMPMPAGWGN